MTNIAQFEHENTEMDACLEGFNWMIPNLYVENGGFTKHPVISMVVWGSRW